MTFRRGTLALAILAAASASPEGRSLWASTGRATLARSHGAYTGHAVESVPTSKTRAYVEALASERFDGRLTGSTGERLASDYIIAQLQRIGAKPLPGG